MAGSDGFEKNSYRKFNIQDALIKDPNPQVPENLKVKAAQRAKAGGDDYYMMRQVLRRRFSKVANSLESGDTTVKPDLVLIDGGAGHLSTSLEVAEELKLIDICFVAIAKGPDRNAGREVFHQSGKRAFSLEPNDPCITLSSKASR